MKKTFQTKYWEVRFIPHRLMRALQTYSSCGFFKSNLDAVIPIIPHFSRFICPYVPMISQLSKNCEGYQKVPLLSNSYTHRRTRQGVGRVGRPPGLEKTFIFRANFFRPSSKMPSRTLMRIHFHLNRILKGCESSACFHREFSSPCRWVKSVLWTSTCIASSATREG